MSSHAYATCVTLSLLRIELPEIFICDGAPYPQVYKLVQMYITMSVPFKVNDWLNINT